MIPQQDASIGLVVFAAVWAITGVGFGVDVLLYLLGLPMITTMARDHAWFAGLVALFELVGVAGLCVHFIKVTASKGLFN